MIFELETAEKLQNAYDGDIVTIYGRIGLDAYKTTKGHPNAAQPSMSMTSRC